MEPQRDKSIGRLIIGLIIALVVLVFLAGLIGWGIGRNNNESASDISEPASGNEAAEPQSAQSTVDELVTYSVPAGYSKSSCDSQRDEVYIVNGSDLPDCEAVPEESITLQIDENDNTDCDEIQDVVSVSRHVCRSVFIDGRKTLEASTTYTEVSSYMPERTIDAYYMNTGKGVVLARYIHGVDAPESTAFHDLVYSMRVK